MWESSQWLISNILSITGKKEFLESMNRCTGRRDITEITLKTALSVIQSINQSVNQYNTYGKIVLLNKAEHEVKICINFIEARLRYLDPEDRFF